MKTYLKSLAFCAIVPSVTAHAEIAQTVQTDILDSLPLSEDAWSISSYHQSQTGEPWVWLRSEIGEAMIIYPRKESPLEVIAPWGDNVTGDTDAITVSLRSFAPRQWHLARLGGEIVINGQSLSILYHMPTTNDVDGVHYDLLSQNSLNIGGKHHARVQTSGNIVSITGTRGQFDELYGPNSPTLWQFHTTQEGNLRAQSWSSSIAFNGFESFYGSNDVDDFEFYFDPNALFSAAEVTAPFSLDGGGGADSLSIRAPEVRLVTQEAVQF